MTQEPTILLMAQPGHLRDSLRVLLAALSGSHPVVLTSDWPVETLSAINGHPVLVLVILEPESPRTEVSAVVSQIKTRWPQTRMVALVDTEQQRKA
jgi:hypothetical protein